MQDALICNFTVDSSLYSIEDNFKEVKVMLTLPASILDEEKKLTKIFIFTLLCGASKGFMKAFTAFLKPS